ncbi:MAG: glycerol-3-phosphate 1-O-acyltransferase PlsY [Clostridia bacterium]|nr:glycerol-3-phosphate 1-O-acyltransferase PlsY [Clostridia bacterium]
MLAIIISAIVAYLLGSINTSIIVSKLFAKSDIRSHGSGNAGATNTLRVLGKKAAALVVIGDGLKGVLAILAARYVAHALSEGSAAEYIAAVFVVLGHVFPVFFGFRGGKGIMTSIAVVFTLSPSIGAILVVIFVVLVFLFNYISLASVISALCFPILVLIMESGDILYMVCALIIAIIAVVKHHTNIARLIKGTENKFIKSRK